MKEIVEMLKSEIPRERRSLPGSLAAYIRRLHPAQIITYSYLGMLIIGTALLSLPAASAGEPIPLIDAFFTAASALCVTGLTVVDTGTALSLFGKIVLLALIQIGGLGVMTFSVLFFHLLGRGMGTKGRWIMTESFASRPVRKITSLLGSIFFFTFVAEAAGAAFLYHFWHSGAFDLSALFCSIFHAVSAFCNAGFSFFESSFESYRGSILFNLTICTLIVLGGIGFPVIYELSERVLALRRKRRSALTLHARSVLTVTVVLIVVGAILFLVLEWNNSLALLSLREKLLASLFQSITARTAGFNTVRISSLDVATLFVLIMLMFIGASPGSCGGGIKTTSLAILVSIMKSRIRGNPRANIFNRTIPAETVSRALAIFILAVFVISAGIIFLLITQQEPPQEYFLTYVFEAVSAFGTVGLSMGATSMLTASGKIVIVLLMLLGRVGLLTVAYVVTARRMQVSYRFAEEKVMIG